MEFSKESILQGRANREASVETPETFSTIDGASQPRGGTELDKKNRKRMAGEAGDLPRALELMNNPNEQARVQRWMAQFNMFQGNGMEPS